MNKIYGFDYGNFFKFILSKFMEVIYNAFALIVLGFPLSMAYGYFENLFQNNERLQYITVIVFICILIIIVLLLLALFILPKRIILSNNLILINRYSINYSYITRGIKDEILISSINYCEIYEDERPLLWRASPYAVFFFNWDNLVEIRTNDRKVFLVPVKNAENFVEEVNMLMETAQNNTNGKESIND